MPKNNVANCLKSLTRSAAGKAASNKRRADFDADLLNLVKVTPFTVFGIGIRKDAFKNQFVDNGIDPYLPNKVYDLAIMLMIERYVDYLATHSTERRIGRVNLESIGARDDAEHQAAYANLLLYGTQYVPQNTFQSWVEAGCRFSPKTGSNPAELADIVAREVFEWTRSGCATDPKYWHILSAKAYLRPPGHYGAFGIKVFPGDDLDEEIQAHRAKCGAGPRS